MRIALGHLKAVVISKLLDKLWRHSRLQHLRNASVLQRIELIRIRKAESGTHDRPCTTNVTGTQHASAGNITGRKDIQRRIQSGKGPKKTHDIIRNGKSPRMVVLGNIGGHSQKAFRKINVTDPEHHNLLGTNKQPVTKHHDPDKRRSFTKTEIIKNPCPVNRRNDRTDLGIRTLALNTAERIILDPTVICKIKEKSGLETKIIVEGLSRKMRMRLDKTHVTRCHVRSEKGDRLDRPTGIIKPGREKRDIGTVTTQRIRTQRRRLEKHELIDSRA